MKNLILVFYLFSVTTFANASLETYVVNLQSIEYIANVAKDGSLKHELHVVHNSCSERKLKLDTQLLQSEGVITIVDEGNIDCRTLGSDRVYVFDVTGLRVFKIGNYLMPSFKYVE